MQSKLVGIIKVRKKTGVVNIGFLCIILENNEKSW